MSLKITLDCINCGACISECPNVAIYEGGQEWRMSDGTTHPNTHSNKPLSQDKYYIATDKCTECKGFHEESQCASVCPVDCCVTDVFEPESMLLARKELLHGSK